MGQTKPQDGCVQSLLLQYIKQRIFACVVLAPSGEVELECIINTFILCHFVVVFLCVYAIFLLLLILLRTLQKTV